MGELPENQLDYDIGPPLPSRLFFLVISCLSLSIMIRFHPGPVTETPVTLDGVLTFRLPQGLWRLYRPRLHKN